MSLMVRRARNDFDALLMGNAIEGAGGRVISMTFNGMHQEPGAMVASPQILVWARVESDADIRAVDDAIDVALGARAIA